MNLRLPLQSALPGRLLPRMRTAVVIAVLLVVSILAPNSIASAATLWTVNDSGDSGTTTCGTGICQLRDALNKTVSGDTIGFSPGLNGQTILLMGGELAITNKSLTIAGPGANQLGISGLGTSRVFDIQDPSASSMVVSISGLTIEDGSAGFDNDGGALLISRPVGTNSLSVNLDGLTIQGSTAGVTSNATYSQGGGIFSQRATLKISNSTISGNIAYGPSANGGGLVATGSDGSGGNDNTLVIINSTITGNAAIDPAGASVPTGGGVEMAFGTATILNTTIDNNSAVRAANLHNGNASATGFPLVIYNSIISNANGTDVTGPNITGPISDAEYDLIDNDASATYLGTKIAITTGANPSLGALANNGGPTQTQKPPLSSPVVNAGNPAGCTNDVGGPLTTDQRGSPRPDPGNRCDEGAYELLALTLSPPGPALPDAIAGVAYGTTISATGSAAPYAYAVTAGSLAPFSLNAATGAISGMSAVPAVLSFTISAVDPFGNTGSKAYTLRVDSGPATQLVVAGFASPTTAGTAHNFTVIAKDAVGNVANVYTGTVHFTSSDIQGILPADYTFVAADNGVHTFSGTLDTAGTQSLTATDTVATTLTGTQAGIVVNPAATATLTLSGYPSPVSAGTSNNFTVIARDRFGNTATNYTGTLHFTSSDAAATLPANSTLINGVGTFSATLDTVGTQSLTATDTVNAALTGTQTGIIVNPGAAVAFVVSGYPSPVTAGTSNNFTVTARDSSGNIATGYAGTVHFSSSDGAAVLPANSTLTNGTGAFSATFRTAGTQSIVATDTVTATVTGTQGGIAVNPGAAALLAVGGYPSPVTAGTSNTFAVTVRDAFGNIVTGYAGILHFTSSDAAAVLPANSALSNGTGTFSATLRTAGTQSLTATDTVATTLAGTQAGIVVNPGAAASFTVRNYPSPVITNTPNTFTVTAQDSSGNTATSYTGTVHFTSSDASAVLPANGTLINGVGTFSATLKTVGTQSLTATDTVTASITGTQTGIVVNPGAAATLVLSGYPSPVTVGTLNNFTVTAKDAFGNTATAYAGTVHFSSSDAAAALPVDSTLTNGAGTFSATLKTVGTQTLTATDTVTASITGAQTGIAVNPGAAVAFAVGGYPSPVNVGTSNAFSVTAEDSFGNTATAYSGTVHFTSSDAQAVLPADYTFVAGDNGVHTFNATLKTPGTQSITVTDSVTATITGAQTGIVVNQTYKVSASVNGSNGTISPPSQTVNSGSAATVSLTPSPGYHALIDPATTCPGGTLVNTTYTSAAITADCSVVAAFAANAPAVLSITLTDNHDYARYGMLLNYVVTVTNSGGDATGVTLSNDFPVQLDPAGTTWTCFGGGGGTTCTASGSGPLNDSGIAIPAGRSVTWLVTALVRFDADGASIANSMSAGISGGSTVSATDSDILVIFRDGFDVPFGDGTEDIPAQETAAATCPANTATENFSNSDTHVVTVPSTPGQAPLDVILTASAANDGSGFRVERANLGATPSVRLVVIAHDRSERASLWAATIGGARLTLATVDAADGSRVLLLEGAQSPLAMPMPAGISDTLQFQTQATMDGSCD